MLIYLFLLITSVFGHARITNPVPRIKNVSGGLNAPIYTCLGPAFGTSPTSMRCHDSLASPIIATYSTGSNIDLEWTMEAPHPGDCSIWLSYDTNVDSPVNWIKLRDIPGCLSPNGIDTPVGINKYSFQLPDFLPSCEHCVLRWEWYAVQQVSNVEFYVNCIDIKIVSQNTCSLPGPTTQINGIEHLLYNLNDPNQKGCPFYNVYDVNFRPPLNKRSRGPKEWNPTCTNGPFPTTLPQPTTPIIVYPCANVNCGNFGSCIEGVCVCTNGYSGKNCEIQPNIGCNINCKNLNRKGCQTNNICGNCLDGFIGTQNSNTLCKIQCNNNFCKSLNRKKCINKNICGNCIKGFTEPNSMLKSDKCNLVPINNNGIKLSITSKWVTGFCGQWIYVCYPNKVISFQIPPEITDLRGWNIINMEKNNNIISGVCPTFAQPGQEVTGGFCASFPFGKNIFIGEDGYLFEQKRVRRLESDKIMETPYTNVSITINGINNLDYNDINNKLQTNLYGSSEVIILDDENSELSIKINCKNIQDFDSALFLHSVDDLYFNPEPIGEENNGEYNASNKIKVLTNFMVILWLFYILSSL